ncbi:MAG: DUF3006 domain-containing protein [Clostridia bacterium]|nr:DUF3006 domain-containing protein [Clostridia bacterium]
MFYFTVDRIENGVAVAVKDDGRSFDIALGRLPKGTREGDVIMWCRRRGFYKSAGKREEREARVKTLTEKIFRNP